MHTCHYYNTYLKIYRQQYKLSSILTFFFPSFFNDWQLLSSARRATRLPPNTIISVRELYREHIHRCIRSVVYSVIWVYIRKVTRVININVYAVATIGRRTYYSTLYAHTHTHSHIGTLHFIDRLLEKRKPILRNRNIEWKISNLKKRTRTFITHLK